MKRSIITVLMLIFSISLCIGQTLQQEAERHRQIEAQQRQAAEEQKRRESQSLKEEAERQRRIQAEAEKQRQETEAKKRQELEQRYQDAIASAQSNFNLQKYEQAKNDYKTALDIKPENAASINPKIAEIDEILRQQAEAERERKYQDLITSAQRKFNQRQYEQAKKDYESALELMPGNLTFIDTKIAEIERKMNEPATLYIYRKFNVQGALVGPYDVLLDNKIVARTENRGSKETVSVKTFGNKTVSAKIKGQKDEIQINFEPGGVYYVKCSVDYKGTGRYEYKDGKREEVKESFPTLQLVSKKVGESEFNEMKDKKR